MDNHHTPQHYLKQFAIEMDSGKIWVFDKESRKCREQAIKPTGMERDFYTDEYEPWLNEKVERPAQKPLEHMREGKPISEQDRKIITVYIASMMTRGPANRRRMVELVPSVAPMAATAVREDTASRSNTEQLISEIDDYESALVQDGLPEELRDVLLRAPEIPPEVALAIYEMAWEVIIFPDRSKARLITSDNPVLFDAGVGIGSPDGEIFFPLSAKVALHGHWHGNPASLKILEGGEPFATNLNRRMAVWAERWVYSGREPRWVGAVLDNYRIWSR